MERLRLAALTIFLQGEYDVSTGEALRRQLAAAERADAVTIDLTGVTYAGTTLLNELITLRNRMRGRGNSGAIRLVGGSAGIRKVLTITRLDQVFEVA